MVAAAGALTGCGSASLRTTDGGAGGKAGATGAGGKAGGAGADGGASCTDTTSDPNNCGACGHSCLGGTCSTSVCQPFPLGTTTQDKADHLQLSGGMVYVLTENGATSGQTRDVWSLDAATPSTPVEIQGAPSPSNAYPGCVMGGTLYLAPSTCTVPCSLYACSVSNCAATSQPIVANSISAIVAGGPYCDVANQQIVWFEETINIVNGSISYAVARAAVSGGSRQLITTVPITGSSTMSWRMPASTVIDSGNPDRLFYEITDSGAHTGTLYYLSTVSPNTTLVPLATLPGIFQGGIVADDATAIFTMFPGGTDAGAEESWAVPLPNGVTSGAPPVFSMGGAVGIVDQTSFYGLVPGSASFAADAFIRCALPSCSNPVTLARGQSTAQTFVEDATAVYWTTTGSGNKGFTVWKVAK